MAPKTRQQLGILAGLLAILLVVLVFNRDGDPVSATRDARARRRRDRGRARPSTWRPCDSTR